MRPAVESTLRVLTLGALGLLLWRWTHPMSAPAATPELVVEGDSTKLGGTLTRWATEPVAAGHVALGGAPDGRTRAWLHALGGAGMRVTWSAREPRPLAASATAVVDPAGGVRVEVADAPGTAIAVGDVFATTDTVRTRGGLGVVVLPTASDSVIARAGATTARLLPPTAPRLGAVLVLGRAGWEAKFVAAALEERGWLVRLRVAVAPGLSVVQGGDAALDTATTAAVVVLDSGAVTAADGERIARFVRTGGGLVLAGDAAAASSLRALAPGAVGTAMPGVPGAIDGATPLRGLSLWPVEPPRADAVVLERREGGSAIAVAARRVGAGRVAQAGYAETWRWRMAADDASPAAHRGWWARLVGAVAYAPAPVSVADVADVADADPAPLAATIASLGRSQPAPASARRGLPAGPFPPDGWLAVLAAAGLLGEVASRRLRGAR